MNKKEILESEIKRLEERKRICCSTAYNKEIRKYKMELERLNDNN